MELLFKLVYFLVIINVTLCQNRQFFRRRHNQGRNNFGNFHRNHQQFQHVQHNPQYPHQYEHPTITTSVCSQIEFLRALDDRWYGSFHYNPVRYEEGIVIEIEFGDQVIGFVNDFSYSNSLDNRVFVIRHDSKILKRGEPLQFNFFVNFNALSRIPPVKRVKVNNDQLCPDETELLECVKLEMINKAIDSWEGFLRIYPHQYNIGNKIGFQFDRALTAFVNDAGDSVTNDQKIFLITNHKVLHPKTTIMINFIAKFDQFKEVPRLQNIYIDNNPVCLQKPEDMNRSDLRTTSKPPFTRAINILKLESLPFNLFPNVTSIPASVQNQNFECGQRTISLNFRLDEGEIAYQGQFPFHGAMFYNSTYRCAASLISEKASLTAAHCVVDSEKDILPVDNFHLLFGAIDLESLTGNEILRKVSIIYRHPGYSHNKILKQDIAILIHNGIMQFSKFIQPICLPEDSFQMDKKVGTDMAVLGFGSTTESLETSRYLHHGKMTVISRDECTENIIFALLPQESTFCAKRKDTGLCPGDSGGAITEVINDRYYLIGIASVTVTGLDGKCNVKNPVGFTGISTFLNWIKENMD